MSDPPSKIGVADRIHWLLATRPSAGRNLTHREALHFGVPKPLLLLPFRTLFPGLVAANQQAKEREKEAVWCSCSLHVQIGRLPDSARPRVTLSVNSISDPIGIPWAIRLTTTPNGCNSR